MTFQLAHHSPIRSISVPVRSPSEGPQALAAPELRGSHSYGSECSSELRLGYWLSPSEREAGSVPWLE